MGFTRRGRTETVTVKSFGEPEQITLRQLSAYDVDAIRNAHPPPIAPRREVDGAVVIDEKDDDYRRAASLWSDKFLLLQVCAQVVEPKFDSEDPEEQAVALASSRTKDELFDLAAKAFMIGRGEIRDDHMEAAKERLTPIDSSVPDTEKAES